MPTATTENPNLPGVVHVAFVGVRDDWWVKYAVYADNHFVGYVFNEKRSEWWAGEPRRGAALTTRRAAAQHLIDTFAPGPVAYPLRSVL